jgi:hypothetical protein
MAMSEDSCPNTLRPKDVSILNSAPPLTPGQTNMLLEVQPQIIMPIHIGSAVVSSSESIITYMEMQPIHQQYDVALGLVNQLLEFKEGSEDMIKALTGVVTTK